MLRGIGIWLAVAVSAAAFADEGAAPAAWAACPDRSDGPREKRPYLLGRYERGVAVLEAGSSGSARLASLWAHASPGGTTMTWPGGRPGVRHLTDPKKFGEASVAAQAGRVYLWTSANGWNGGETENVTSVELAKSLCDARDIVVYLVTKAPESGAGFALATTVAPAEASDAPPSEPPDTPRSVMARIYSSIVAALDKDVKAQKLAPASLAVNVYPGKFTEDALQYAVSLRWGNAFDDRFSLLYLADKDGNLARLVDQQEGGAGGTLLEAADVDGDGYLELFYRVTTLDGSSDALWSLKGGKTRAIVQTTPVGE